MIAKLDFSNVSDGFTLLEKGNYPCFVFEVEERETRKGDQMFVLILSIAEGEAKGRQLFYNLPILPQTMWKVKETLEACGLEIPKSVVEIDFDDLLGTQVIAVVDHRVANAGKRKGETVETVETLLPIDGAKKPAPGEKKASKPKKDEAPF